MRKHLIELAPQAEMDAHLGYELFERHAHSNTRNGFNKIMFKTEKSPIATSEHQDHNGGIETQILSFTVKA